MRLLRSFLHGLKAARQLGAGQVGLYVVYQLGLRSGYYRWAIRRSPQGEMPSRLISGASPAAQDPLESPPPQYLLSPLFDSPSPESLASTTGHRSEDLLVEAEEILYGQVRLFGGEPVPLQLAYPAPLKHWTAYADGQARPAEIDIKFIWEVGRFGWAVDLARAYRLTDDERYAEAFWNYWETFQAANPPYLGPQWASAQEVAIRLISLAFAYNVFQESIHSTPGRTLELGRSLAAHARRIPATLVYARAQNNNHLLTEAAGLYTAGRLLPGHPHARRWRQLGWRWFHHALQAQIAPDGAYLQHSANYQRLMLQACLWVWSLSNSDRIQDNNDNLEWPAVSVERLAAATRWLAAMQDADTGRLPNLGPNDGATLLALSTCPFDDYRPALQAASLAFLGERRYEPGPWDEPLLWFGLRPPEHSASQVAFEQEETSPECLSQSPQVIRLSGHPSWAMLRVASYKSRPGHSDQLHLDLWWRGLNLAQDPGTYLYNAPPPWDNTLAVSSVHNTITLEGQDPMTRAGRFLWLDWAQGEVIDRRDAPDGSFVRVTAQHEGYRRFGVIHRRMVSARNNGRWKVVDCLLPFTAPGRRIRQAVPARLLATRLHWLIPDWPWEVQPDDNHSSFSVLLESPHGPIHLRIEDRSISRRYSQEFPLMPQIVRAGELVFGAGRCSPTWGWSSPTYGARLPALSLSVVIAGSLPVTLASIWQLP